MEMFKFIQHALINYKYYWKPHNIEYFRFPSDNHTFSLNWTRQPTEKDKTIVLLVPGFMTDHANPYTCSFVNRIKKDHVVCVIDYPLLCSEVTGDTLPDFLSEKYLRYALNIVRKRHPEQSITLFGLSMGGTLAIKCSELADKVIAVCSPVRVVESWDAIKKGLYPMFKSLFLFGPLKKLVIKDPKKWSKNFIDVVLSNDVDKLSSIIDELTGKTVYNVNIISEITNPVMNNITMIHTKDDSIVPYIPNTSGIFNDINRIVFDKGNHLLFDNEQIKESAELI